MDRHDQLSDGASEVPQFVNLFDVCACDKEHCDRCSGFQLTPRTAAALWAASTLLGDMAYDDVETLGDDPLSDDSAAMVLDRYLSITYRQDAVWRRQAARAFDDLTSDIERGGWPQPTCVGEEMALHLVIQDAEASRDDEAPLVHDLVQSLPAHTNDFDWYMCSEVLSRTTTS